MRIKFEMPSFTRSKDVMGSILEKRHATMTTIILVKIYRAKPNTSRGLPPYKISILLLEQFHRYFRGCKIRKKSHELDHASIHGSVVIRRLRLAVDNLKQN